MNPSNAKLQAEFFSHIYVEEEATQYEITNKILERFKNSRVISINHYKDIFNRSRQDFVMQKNAPSLILAVNHGNLIYPGARVCQDFGNSHFYYTSNVLNCIYNCDYCYLQGMYPSAHIVIFVNIEDTFLEVKKLLKEHPVYLCISYDTDLLVLDELTGFVTKWCEFTMANPDLKIEIRTKSACLRGFDHYPVSPSIIFAWTLSPNLIINNYEHHTPGLEERLKGVILAQNRGYTVRLCFDPMIYVKNYQEIYSDFFKTVFDRIDTDKLNDLSLGLFRISSSYIKSMRKKNCTSISCYPSTNDNGVCCYDKKLSNEMLSFAKSQLLKYIPAEKIFESSF